MSKQLIKIICICALVVICPLIIVGVSIMATEAVGYTLTICEGGIEKVGEVDFGGKSSQISIIVDGKTQTSNKITLTKRTEVTVTFNTDNEVCKGYDFIGWYNGNYSEINVETDSKLNKQGESSYTFEITKNTVLTAVRNVKTYTVNYTEFLDMNGSPVSFASQDLVYNQDLMQPSLDPTDTRVFTGWREKSETGVGDITRKANFENSGAVNVVPAWEEEMQVTYVAQDGVTKIYQETLTESQVASYTLLNETNPLVKEAVGAGYEFVGWKANGQSVNGFDYDTNGITLVLDRKLVNYTLNVKYHALSTSESQVAFDVSNGFGAYNVTRENYVLKGFEYNQTLYTNLSKDGDLARSILALDGATTVDVTAVWECEYPSEIVFNFEARADYTYQELQGRFLVKGIKDGQVSSMSYADQTVYFEDKENTADEYYFDVNSNVCDYFINKYSDVKTFNDESVEFANEVIITVIVDGVSLNTRITEDVVGGSLTFAQILESAKTVNNGTLEKVTGINLQFVYQVV